jgi:cation diffusion facilitator family transporter
MTSAVSAAERRAITHRVTLAGAAVDAVLGILKLAVGWMAQSHALIADGLHSLSDLATDALVLLAARHAHAEPDDEHPYGHERIETAATVGLGIALVVVGLGVAIDAVRRLLHPELLLAPQAWAIGAALVSIIAKEWVFRFTIAAARKINSGILAANAWHSRSDALSSLVVCVGLLGTMAGLNYVDALAALVVGAMIAQIGWQFAWHSMRELIDTGLGDDELETIRETILAIPGVGSLHELRTRRMAAKALVDVHIILSDARVSVSEGHQISELVRARLMRALDAVSDVIVHIDPENDEDVSPGVHLPMRDEFRVLLGAIWGDLCTAATLDAVTLHYLGGHIHIDVHLDMQPNADVSDLGAQLIAAAAAEPLIGEVRVFVNSAPK